MNILKYLLLNWDSVIVCAVVCAVVIIIIAKKQYAILDKIVFVLVTEAEKKYDDGTGSIKLASVIDWAYPKIPAIIRLFITSDKLVQIIERVLKEAKIKWELNPKLSEYLGKTNTE